MLRLIHAPINHVDIKRAFFRYHDLPGGRIAVENCNMVEAHMDSVWQMTADKWNDLNFLPVTAVLPELHSDFERPIPLLYKTVSHMQKATSEKVEERGQLMNLQLNRIISHWERSGHGDGEFMNEFDHEVEECVDGEMTKGEPVFGSLKNRPQRALNQRKNFIVGKSTYLLYLWGMLETHDLICFSMHHLDSSVCSGNGSFGVPSIIGNKHSPGYDDDSISSSAKCSKKAKRPNDVNELSLSIAKYGESLIAVAKNCSITAREGSYTFSL